jgi:hypothetical protein
MRGRIQKADSLASRINNIIVNINSNRSAKLTNASSKDLWKTIEGKGGKHNEKNRYGRILSSPDFVNAFFETYANAENNSLAEVLDVRHVILPEELQKITRIALTEVDIEPFFTQKN